MRKENTSRRETLELRSRTNNASHSRPILQLELVKPTRERCRIHSVTQKDAVRTNGTAGPGVVPRIGVKS